MTLPRRAAAEGLGTALLLAAVVGSGIMGERLSGGNEAVALLANAIATGCALSGSDRWPWRREDNCAGKKWRRICWLKSSARLLA
jgi:hypothetical protein